MSSRGVGTLGGDGPGLGGDGSGLGGDGSGLGSDGSGLGGPANSGALRGSALNICWNYLYQSAKTELKLM